MINLLPPDRLLKLHTARLNTILRRYIIFLVCGVLFLSLVIGYGYLHLKQQNDSVKQIVDQNRSKIESYNNIEKRATELSGTIDTIAGLFTNDLRFSNLLTKIGSLIPPGSVLTGLKFSISDLDQPLEITAQVDDVQKAAVLRNNLANSNLFVKAETQKVSSMQTANNEAVPPAEPDQQTVYRYTTVINVYFSKSALGGSL